MLFIGTVAGITVVSICFICCKQLYDNIRSNGDQQHAHEPNSQYASVNSNVNTNGDLNVNDNATILINGESESEGNPAYISTR